MLEIRGLPAGDFGIEVDAAEIRQVPGQRPMVVPGTNHLDVHRLGVRMDRGDLLETPGKPGHVGGGVCVDVRITRIFADSLFL